MRCVAAMRQKRRNVPHDAAAHRTASGVNKPLARAEPQHLNYFNLITEVSYMHRVRKKGVAVCLPLTLPNAGVLNRSIWYWHRSYLRPTLHCGKRIRVSSKITVLSVWNLYPNSELSRFFCLLATACRPSLVLSTYSSTDDRCQFITLSVRFCLQQHGRTALRGSSATAETCLCSLGACSTSDLTH